VTLIGLTGGIASGKSTVAERLADHGAVHIDADRLTRDVQAPGSAGLSRIVGRFGPGILAADGSLDRPALGRIVFPDPEARRDLEAIVHPAVQAEARRITDAAHAADPDAVVVYNVPLLAETGGRRDFALVVVVEAPEDLRVRRLVELRGMAEDEARGRIRSQATDAERRALADVVIDASGTMEQTLEQTDALWERLRGTAR
jgi:dephospho-CoA kinase